MINITVNGHEYKTPEDWSEITLAKAVEVNEICKDCPEVLKRIYEGEDVELTFEERVKQLPKFYGKILQVISGISPDQCKHILWGDRSAYYHEHLSRFVYGIMVAPMDYEPKGLKSFQHEDVDYIIPKDKNILGNVRPMPEEDTLVFTECADLQILAEKGEKGKLEVMANIISIVCRPKGEPYDEDVSLGRAEAFLNLPMTTVWEVFFYLIGCIERLGNYTEGYLQAAGSRPQRQPSIAG